MLCKIKTNKKRILKFFLIDFSCKEKAITRYTRIGQNKQKALFSLWSLNKNSKNVVVSRGENNNKNIDDSNKN